MKLLIALIISTLASYTFAQTEQDIATARMCASGKKQQSSICGFMGSPQDDPEMQACKINWAANKCDEFVKEHPELQDSDKLLDCSDFINCTSSPNISEQFGACLEGMQDAWTDLAKAAAMFISGKGTAPSEETLSKMDFFKNCTSAECKRDMLGPFASYFTKEEIEGSKDRKDLNPKDIVNQTYLEGYSAAVLYRKLLMKLKKEVATKKMDQKFIEPWSGQAAKLPSSLNEQIDKVLTKTGFGHTECFKKEVVTQMRCEAFFSLFDPTLALGLTPKLVRISGMALKEVVSNTVSATTKILTKSTVKDAAKEPVSVIWYPKAGYIAISHSELKVGDKLYNLYSKVDTHSSAAVQRAATTGQGKAYVEFKIKVSKEEYENLQKNLEGKVGQNVFTSCIGGVCKALHESTNVVIPAPFRYTPTGAAVYLTAAKKLGYSRITDIKFVGKGSAVKGIVGTEVINETWLNYTVGYWVVQGVSAAGEAIQHLIPLEVDDSNK